MRDITVIFGLGAAAKHLVRGCLLVLPDGLVGQPAGVTLLVAVIISSQQLVCSRHVGTDVLTCPLRLLEGEGVAARRLSVVEHNTWTEMENISMNTHTHTRTHTHTHMHACMHTHMCTPGLVQGVQVGRSVAS